MPVHRQKKDITPHTPCSTQQQPAFHQHLRALSRRAVRVVIEAVMREELDQFLGVV